MSTASNLSVAVCLLLADAISRAETADDIYTIALDALANGLNVSRASVLLVDHDGVMRFKASRGLSDAYQRQVEGHTPWWPDGPNPQPIVVRDVSLDPSLQAHLPIIRAEGIASMACIPLVNRGSVLGKFMLYYDLPREPAAEELQVARIIASQIASAVARMPAEEARLSAAEEANRLKDEFLATLSHELRTPMNAILGWVQLLHSRGMSADRVQDAVEIIGRNARLQAQLIEDILDVSRISNGKLEIERSPLSVPHLMQLLLTGALPSAKAKNITLISNVPETLPAVDGDFKRLHQVFGNLLSNAIKFTPPGGRIEIRAAVEGDAIHIELQDSGVGIEPRFLPYVFDRFRQADSRSTRRHGGLGLGLAIARHLVERHGGRIEPRSEGRGRGTTMTVWLPVGKGAGRSLDRGFGALPAARESGLEMQLDGSLVLVVDDEKDSRELLAALFERCGARVVQCESAETAWPMLAALGIGLLVADIAMPDIDGYELIRLVRQRGGRLPAVAVSAHARPQDRAKALAAGFDGYCAKPIDVDQLLRTVRDVMHACLER